MPKLMTHEWDKYNWNKLSLAIVASDGAGHGAVLFTAGPHVAFDIHEIGLRDLWDLGLDDAPSGVWVWEGKHVGGDGSRSPEGDYSDAYLQGTYRPLTDEEWAALKRNECPWSDEEWIEPETRHA